RQYLSGWGKCGAVGTRYCCCAWNAIDWSLPIPRIADRTHPLRPKTIQRIQTGLDKFAGAPFTLMTNQGPVHTNLRALTDALQTQTSAVPPGLAVPPFLL